MLRADQGFEGVIATDSLDMEGAGEGGSVPAAVAALDAGADLHMDADNLTGPSEGLPQPARKLAEADFWTGEIDENRNRSADVPARLAYCLHVFLVFASITVRGFDAEYVDTVFDERCELRRPGAGRSHGGNDLCLARTTVLKRWVVRHDARLTFFQESQ